MEYKLKTNEINIRDPFVVPYEGKYYMYGSRSWLGLQQGFDVYVSEDLENWSGPVSVFDYFEGFWGEKDFWAPEVHFYKGKFYLFASFKGNDTCRGTAIFVGDSPKGPFKEHSKGAVTPTDWECLDGTLYVSPEGKPYMVFCHEWLQAKDGTVCAVELSDDLSCAVSEPFLMWHASDAPWVAQCRYEGEYVTDGPYMVTLDDELIAIWSSYNERGYAVSIARSDDGTIYGRWTPDEKELYDENGGHGMIFETFEGTWKFVCHVPNSSPDERPFFRDITKKELERK
ncbi:MAG: family 43 glycosylhydrolase [Tyzzerella sp.]|nr:family 43 glycosylhydrolase [Tyzzerella sp.]